MTPTRKDIDAAAAAHTNLPEGAILRMRGVGGQLPIAQNFETLCFARNNLTAIADLLEQQEKLLAEAVALLRGYASMDLVITDWLTTNKDKLP